MEWGGGVGVVGVDLFEKVFGVGFFLDFYFCKKCDLKTGLELF